MEVFFAQSFVCFQAHGTIDAMEKDESLRVDKWLWFARFFRTRSLAAEEITKGRVRVNGVVAKASREVRPGDTVDLRQGHIPRTVVVRGISNRRGAAPAAQQLYEETPESLSARAMAAERQRLSPEPAAALHEGRPTKRDRRDIDKVRGQPGGTGGWGDRWSATLDE